MPQEAGVRRPGKAAGPPPARSSGMAVSEVRAKRDARRASLAGTQHGARSHNGTVGSGAPDGRRIKVLPSAAEVAANRASEQSPGRRRQTLLSLLTSAPDGSPRGSEAGGAAGHRSQWNRQSEVARLQDSYFKPDASEEVAPAEQSPSRRLAGRVAAPGAPSHRERRLLPPRCDPHNALACHSDAPSTRRERCVKPTSGIVA